MAASTFGLSHSPSRRTRFQHGVARSGGKGFHAAFQNVSRDWGRRRSGDEVEQQCSVRGWWISRSGRRTLLLCQRTKRRSRQQQGRHIDYGTRHTATRWLRFQREEAISMRVSSQNIFETLTSCSRPRCRFSHLLKAAGESSTWFICVSLRADVLYPVAARITVSDGTTLIAQARIPRKDVDGLYPGDVWALDLRHKRVKK